MRTAQELFDTIVTHLRTQGVQSKDEMKGVCLYRGPNSTKCAVGILIPDELYRPNMEDNNIDSLIEKDLVPSELVEEFSSNKALLLDLQYVHDQSLPEYWEEGLSHVARKHHLQYLPPEKL